MCPPLFPSAAFPPEEKMMYCPKCGTWFQCDTMSPLCSPPVALQPAKERHRGFLIIPAVAPSRRPPSPPSSTFARGSSVIKQSKARRGVKRRGLAYFPSVQMCGWLIDFAAAAGGGEVCGRGWEGYPPPPPLSSPLPHPNSFTIRDRSGVCASYAVVLLSSPTPTPYGGSEWIIRTRLI